MINQLIYRLKEQQHSYKEDAFDYFLSKYPKPRTIETAKHEFEQRLRIDNQGFFIVT